MFGGRGTAEGMDEGAMPRTLLDLDSPTSWPAELHTYLDEHYDLFLAWETKLGKFSGKAFDKAIYGLRDILQAYEILGWHCTRLTDAEVDEILRDGMELPNAEMLTRRIDALLKTNVIEPDVARRLKSENHAGEERRAGMVWFCFSPPGNVDEDGIGRFFRHWGGEALYVCHEDDPVTSTVLRVRPETLCRITEFSEHESNGRELDEGERVAVEVLPVLGQSAAAVEPGDGAFDHPTPGLDDEALHPIGSLDDLGLEIGQDAGQGAVKDRPLIGAVGEQFPENGKQTEQGRQQRETAVAILNVGGGDDAVQQQALRIDQNMPLLALDQLAGIEAVAVDASPPFSALFTL